MKHRIAVFLIALLCAATAIAQNQRVSLHINHLLEGQPFEYDKIVRAPGNYSFRVEMLRYYVSKIKIIHDGGKVSEANDIYLLVNPKENSEYPLGSFNLTTIEAIEFGIGVDKDKNHLDPASYPAISPLAPQNPTMHWGWDPGYRFITFEGYAGAIGSSAKENFQIHTVGDELYRIVTIPVQATAGAGGLLMTLNAEYTKLLSNIDVQSGLIAHGSGSDPKQMTENIATMVFSAATATTSVRDENSIALSIAPNPARNTVTLQLPVLPAHATTVVVRNILGQKLAEYGISNTRTELLLNLSAGCYSLQVEEQGKIIAREQLLIAE